MLMTSLMGEQPLAPLLIVSVTGTTMVVLLGAQVYVTDAPVGGVIMPEGAFQLSVATGVVELPVAVSVMLVVPSAGISSAEAESFKNTGQPEGAMDAVATISTMPASAAGLGPWHTIDTLAKTALPACTATWAAVPLQVIEASSLVCPVSVIL
jgi:hypothetical protein